MKPARILALPLLVALWGLSACSERPASAPASPPGYSYFAMLRQKLQWSERPKGC